MEKHFRNTESPGPFSYCENKFLSDIKPILSTCKMPQASSFPKKPRIVVSKEKVDGPSPNYYKNSNEIASKTTLRRNGCFSMPKQSKTADPSKWSSMHSELVSKGIY